MSHRGKLIKKPKQTNPPWFNEWWENRIDLRKIKEGHQYLFSYWKYEFLLFYELYMQWDYN